ncbi:MAG: response regulator [Labilithrix sp.]|nr:response regulator [Labilithrix sp.]MCW5814424.1 response regulator [Labilithrix sp.]
MQANEPASILLVDDTPANLFALSAVLKPLGARIVEAKSGPEAIEHVAKESFAVALLDVQMPEMDGFEAAEKIRAMDGGRELPIIFLTAIHRDDRFVKRGYDAGAADYITKPFDADIVRARVRAFVKLYEQREATRQAQVAVRTQERDEAIRRLVAFERIATAALQTADLSAFLNELLGVFMSAAADADSATILLRDGDELRVQASVGLEDALIERFPVKAGDSFVGSVAASRQPMELHDAAASSSVRSPALRARGTKGLYAVPLLHDGDVLGVAHIGSVRTDTFSDADKRLFGAMVERAAWAVGERVKRARLHEILASAPAMIAILKEDGAVDFRNATYEGFFGSALEAPLAALAAAAQESGETRAADELKVSGDRVVRAAAKPLRNHAGSVDRVVLFAIDVTAQANVRAQRSRLLELERTARLEAETASRMKDEFLATVSHELRTPLNAILGWTVTARAKSPPELDRALSIVERNARAQARMIEDVIDVSRVTSGKLRLDMSDVVLDDAVSAALDAVRPAALAKNITLTVETPARVVLHADAQRLQQIVWNLLSNAIKFTPKDGHVKLVTSREDDDVTLTVEDDGEGIEPQFLAHVFEPFRQADASTTRRHGGLGLGLAIVKQMVDAHGGTISVHSDGPGAGARFTIVFPVAGTSATDSAAAQVPSRPPLPDGDRITLGGIKVLVVDDDDDARSLLAHILAERGASVAEADSASSAFDEVERFRPDVIVSDIAMPGGDGYGLIRAVRALPLERGGRTPAIAVTAHARQSDGERAFAAGFQGHMPKPVDLSRLVSMIKNLSGRSYDEQAKA